MQALVKTEYKHVHKHLSFFTDDGYLLPTGCGIVDIARARSVLDKDKQNNYIHGVALCETQYYSYCIKNCTVVGNRGDLVFDCEKGHLTRFMITNSIVHEIEYHYYGKPVLTIRKSIINISLFALCARGIVMAVEECVSMDGNITIDTAGKERFIFRAKTITAGRMDEILGLDLINFKIIIDAEQDPVAAKYLEGRGYGCKTRGSVCSLSRKPLWLERKSCAISNLRRFL